jgi:hypothetical protein
MAGSYNGHRSWACWNVSLWIGNDEGLYNLALECIRGTRNRREAAQAMLNTLNEGGCVNTPDGARYTVTSIRLAMREMQ